MLRRCLFLFSLLILLAAGTSLLKKDGNPVLRRHPNEPRLSRERAPANPMRPAEARTQPDSRRRAARALSRLSGVIIPNGGTLDPRVKFSLKDRNVSIFFTPDGWTLSALWNKKGSNLGRPSPEFHNPERPPHECEGVAIQTQLVGGRLADPEGEGETNTRVHQYGGSDSTTWREGLPAYSRLVYRDVWPSVDVVCEPRAQAMEYTIVVRPGGDVENVRLAYRGSAPALDGEGNLILGTSAGNVEESRPTTYSGEKVIASRFKSRGDGTYGFDVAEYDRTQTLLIDPTLSYGTYIGGAGDDEASSIAVDSAGNAYVTGVASTGFPVTIGPVFGGGSYDAFVTKLNAGGAGVAWSTYVGGNGNDIAYGIDIDASGRSYIAGYTASTNFPTTAGPLFGGGTYDAFVTSLKADGTMNWSRYLGGTGNDYGLCVTTDGADNAYVAGITTSLVFPTTAGAYKTSMSGTSDAFITKVNSGGATLGFSTFLGGSLADQCNGIALDSSGNVVVSGITSSLDFPTPGGFQTSFGGGTYDGFVTKLNSSGSALVWSSYIGGTGDDEAFGITLDGSNNVFITGVTGSTSGFPTTTGPAFAGGTYDAFVTKINAAGSTLAWSRFLGGTGNEYGRGIAVDGSGTVFVTGYTTSTDFPTTAGAIQSTYGGGTQDAFVTRLSADGASVGWSTYFGGTLDDYGMSVKADASGNTYVAGLTASSPFGSFPTVGAYQTVFGGVYDVFVIKLNNDSPAAPTGLGQFQSDAVTVIPAAGSTTSSTVVFKGTVSDPDGDTVALQVEVKLVGTAFTGVPTATGAQVPSGSVASATVAGLAAGSYHWQARAIDSAGKTSGWVAFGGPTDFVVPAGVGAPPGGGGGGGGSSSISGKHWWNNSHCNSSVAGGSSTIPWSWLWIALSLTALAVMRRR